MPPHFSVKATRSSVRRSACGAHGVRSRLPDLAVIDVGLKDEPEGGFSLCRELRAMSAELPIIFSRRATANWMPFPACASAPTII